MSFVPQSETFSIIDLDGSGALDFAQRMFTRDFRGLKPNEGRLALFLSADGKVQHLFWTFVEDFGLRLFVERDAQTPLFKLIEKYHFADPFKTKMGPLVVTEWEPSEGALKNGARSGQTYECFWKATKFSISTARPASVLSQAGEDEWNEYRKNANIPKFSDYHGQLVFKVQLEELCDAGKGCYIGQEVVERVRTRDLRKSGNI